MEKELCENEVKCKRQSKGTDIPDEMTKEIRRKNLKARHCDICSKSLSVIGVLTEHKCIHIGEMSYCYGNWQTILFK
ncbi:zinc finger 429-like [Octopus vulgaris]|uniref:Zinc finger 429-like n=1 Tax=Octopus vulgaris TaxID=6645 RepID=A0AA36F202_OCTVU|nr:zinc finger 429-like [Octopus vulgaris]